jgi:hypothetical protein
VKIRSDDAIALCSRLYFSERSCSGWKKRRVSWMNAASTPMVSVECSERIPPYQSSRARASAVSSSMAGKNSA